MATYPSKMYFFFEQTLFLAFFLILIDCVLTGYGHWFMVGPFTIRIILWGYCIIGCMPLLIFKKKLIFFSNPIILLVLSFGLYFLIQALRGYLHGNDLQTLSNDIRAYSWIALVPVACIVLNNSERLIILIKGIVISSLALAFLILLSFILSNLSKDGESIITSFIMKYQICSVSRISKSIIRFSCGNMLYIVPTVVYLFFQYLVTSKRSIFLVFLTSLGLITLFFSYTRSYYLGAIVVLIITIGMGCRIYPLKIKKIIVFVFLMTIFSLFILCVFSILFNENYLLFTIQRTFPTLDFSRAFKIPVQTKSIRDYIELTIFSDSIRKKTMDELVRLIRINPLLGNGLGSGVTFRENGRAEYFYQDLIQKMGIIGILLFIAPVFFMIKQSVRSFYRKKYSLDLVFYLGFFAFLISSYFNPLMNSSIGLCYYCICIGILYNSQISKVQD